MVATKTGKVKIVITLRDDVYSLLEEMCRKNSRSKSGEISWAITQSKKAVSTVKVIRPHLSVWKRETV
jgi:predicted CopG family antitoxin